MKSTDQNINHVMALTEIDLANYYSSWKGPNVCYMPCKKFHDLKTKDPLTFYIVEAIDGTVSYYFGEHEIPEEVYPTYLMSVTPIFDKDEKTKIVDENYTIYMAINNPRYGTNLFQVCSYEKAEDAIKAMRNMNRIGSHFECDIRIKDLLHYYIVREITILDFLIGCLSVFGYQRHPDLQKIILMTKAYGECEEEGAKLPALFAEELPELVKYTKENYPTKFNLSNQEAKILLWMLNDIYNIIKKYDYFKDKKYRDNLNDMNFKSIIDSITSIYYNNGFRW